MDRRRFCLVSGVWTVLLLLVAVFGVVLNVPVVWGSGTIYIRADGSIDPPTAPIYTADNVTYTFTDNVYDWIVVERSNIAIDGKGCTLQLEDKFSGFYLSRVNNVTIKNVNFQGSFMNGAVYMEYSSHNTISGNNISNWDINLDAGIQLRHNSSYNIISRNNVTNSFYGIWTYDNSDNNAFFENNMTSNRYGIGLSYSSSNVLKDNNMRGSSYNFEVEGYELSHFIHDVDSSNTVDSKPVYYWVNRQNEEVPHDAGYVALVNSTNIAVRNLELKNNGQGLLLAYTANSKITINDITDNAFAVKLLSSFNNTISENQITNHSCGLFLESSHNTTISSNKIENTQGEGVHLSNSFHNLVSGNNIANNEIGIFSSYDNSFSGNNITNNKQFGIYVGDSNIILGNNITNNNNAVYEDAAGVYVGGKYNTISGNNVTNNRSGIYFFGPSSSFNTVSQNNITNNGYGIQLYYSSNNRFWHNNFIDNPQQVHVEPAGYANVWDDGYPAGGNCWSDYVERYPDAQELDDSGIWDTPYVIDENNQDNYPLMSPYNANVPTLALENVLGWYWASDTYIRSVARGDVDCDGVVEIVTGGYYNDGARDVAQLCVWEGATLALKNVKTWYWTSDTYISSVAVGDVDGDSSVEIVTGGYYWDGARFVAQLCVWDGSTLALENVTAWYWTSDTYISSVVVGDVDDDESVEIVTGGYHDDDVRWNAQLCVWSGPTLMLEEVTTWYWTDWTVISSVAVGDVDGDSSTEIVTGGNHNDGTRNIAQLCVWDGSALTLENVETWCWTSDTGIYSVVVGDVDGDSSVEIVTGGYFWDGMRTNAQLCVWDGSTLTLENVATWYWTAHTVIYSLVAGDVDADEFIEIVTSGSYWDGVRWNAQLCVWDGSALTLDNVTAWYWTSDTYISSVVVGDVDSDSSSEIVTGGYYNDARSNAQLCVWVNS